MLINNKKSLKTLFGSLFFFFLSLPHSQVHSFTPQDLQDAQKALKATPKAPPKAQKFVSVGSLVTPAAFENFRKTAKKIDVGSATVACRARAEEHLSHLKRNRQSLTPPSKRILSVNQVGLSWSQFLVGESDLKRQNIRREIYIAEHLGRLSQNNHVVMQQDRAYNIQPEDLERVTLLTDEFGGKGNLKKHFLAQTKDIASQAQAQKYELERHQEIFSRVISELAVYQRLRETQIHNYIKNYKGAVWEKAILSSYAGQGDVSLSEIKRLAQWIQSDDVMYALDEKADLGKWQQSWAVMLEKDYRVNVRRRLFLEDLEAKGRFGSYMQGVLGRAGRHNNGTLLEMVARVQSSLLPFEYLKTLMAKKRPLVVEILKRAEQGKTLSEQLLHPAENVTPSFVMAKVGQDFYDVKSPVMKEAQQGEGGDSVMMHSVTFDVPLANERGKTKPMVEFQPAQMSLENTYIPTQTEGPQTPLKATENTVLPPLFFTLDQDVQKGWIYNTYVNDLSILGDHAGYVFVDSEGKTSRAYHVIRTEKTLFSSTKTGH